MKRLFIAVAIYVAYASGQTPPTISMNYTATMRFSYSGGMFNYTEINVTMFESMEVNAFLQICEYDDGPSAALSLCPSTAMYTYSPDTQTCTSQWTACPFNSVLMYLPRSQFNGTDVVNGVKAYRWTVPRMPITYWTAVATGYPLREQTIQYDVVYHFDYFTWKPELPPPSAFAVPPYCTPPASGRLVEKPLRLPEPVRVYRAFMEDQAARLAAMGLPVR